MPRKKTKKAQAPETPETPVVETPVETPQETAEIKVAEESEAKKELRRVIANYKNQNPVKYELKKERLEKQLNQL